MRRITTRGSGAYVAVRRLRARGGTRRTVVGAGISAQLVVIGARPRGGGKRRPAGHGQPSGLRQADCSVAVIPEQRAR
ncbi:hypothetical protein [Streptomyces rishiriensis]|uniref:hypothetical protein n=1 Tax=Streptomyces rishiriensis TaxID=68264 RepID=UPI0037CEFFDF